MTTKSKTAETEVKLQQLLAEKAAQKNHGLGAVYRSSTKAVNNIFGMIDTLASSGHTLAQQGEVNSMLGLFESAKEFHEASQNGGLEAVLNTREMMEVLRLLR